MKYNDLRLPRIPVPFLMGVTWSVLLGIACTFISPVSSQATLDLPPPVQPTPPIPTLTLTPPPSLTPNTTQSDIVASSTVSGIPPSCDGFLSIHQISPQEWTKDMFEHHAKGVFLILYIEIFNLTTQDIQIYSNDYVLLIPQGNSTFAVVPHKAATNYLYIVRGGSFYQDKVKAGTQWRTYLAFDIDPEFSKWQLKISPGSTVGMPICEYQLTP